LGLDHLLKLEAAAAAGADGAATESTLGFHLGAAFDEDVDDKDPRLLSDADDEDLSGEGGFHLGLDHLEVVAAAGVDGGVVTGEPITLSPPEEGVNDLTFQERGDGAAPSQSSGRLLDVLAVGFHFLTGSPLFLFEEES
jgi:hypothetical protein